MRCRSIVCAIVLSLVGCGHHPSPASAPAATMASVAPVEIRRGVEHGGPTTDPAARERSGWDRILRPIEPTLIGKPERLALYISTYKQNCLSDRRLFAFNVSGQIGSDGRVVLSGFVE